MSGYHVETANGTSILFMWSTISNALAIVGFFLSDSFLGRFWVIALGSFSSLLGMTLLWLPPIIPKLNRPPCTQFGSNCDSASPGQLIVLLFSFGLMSIGAGCIRPCSIAFGADQKDLNPEGSPINPWNLCAIDQVESLKALLKVILMWSTGFMILVSLNQNSFSTLQASMMDQHLGPKIQIPAGSFTVFTIITLTVWVAIYDRAIVPLLVKLIGKSRGLGAKMCMEIGLVLYALAMAVSAIVENIRRNIAIDQVLVDKPRMVMDMSAMWLIPLFACLGWQRLSMLLARLSSISLSFQGACQVL
ncbi:hypothetical protein SO802_002592 [Lithocarpus litseifolius]|uniref:Uncharacterized protein n=1 Tax=Lithocarpus litseifolius TaxID=425828 RepID=A0AAW2E169_9ROSI